MTNFIVDKCMLCRSTMDYVGKVCTHRFECRHTDGRNGDDTWGIVYAFHPEKAAQTFAQEYDQKWADGPDEHDIMVRPYLREGPTERYEVNWETRIVYHAMRV